MKLIDEKLAGDTSRSDRWFESVGTPSSDYQIGFRLGCSWAEQQLIPLFVEFGEKLSSYRFITTEDGSFWFYKFESNIFHTTKELFDLWMEEKVKQQ